MAQDHLRERASQRGAPVEDDVWQLGNVPASQAKSGSVVRVRVKARVRVTFKRFRMAIDPSFLSKSVREMIERRNSAE